MKLTCFLFISVLCTANAALAEPIQQASKMTPAQRAAMRQAKTGNPTPSPTLSIVPKKRSKTRQIDLISIKVQARITPENPVMAESDQMERSNRKATTSRPVNVGYSTEPFMDLIFEDDKAFARATIDPRDLAYAYIVIGEQVMIKVIGPIASIFDADEVLETTGYTVQQMKSRIAPKDRNGTVKQITQAFLCQNTEQLKVMMGGIGSNMVTNRLKEKDALITSSRDIEIAMELYDRRLAVVKPAKISRRLRSYAANTIRSKGVPGIKIPQNTKDSIDTAIRVNKLHDESACPSMMGIGRPIGLPSASLIESSLAALVIYNSYQIPDFTPIRNTIAHPSAFLFKPFAEYVFNRASTAEVYSMLIKLDQ